MGDFVKYCKMSFWEGGVCLPNREVGVPMRRKNSLSTLFLPLDSFSKRGGVFFFDGVDFREEARKRFLPIKPKLMLGCVGSVEPMRSVSDASVSLSPMESERWDDRTSVLVVDSVGGDVFLGSQGEISSKLEAMSSISA